MEKKIEQLLWRMAELFIEYKKGVSDDIVPLWKFLQKNFRSGNDMRVLEDFRDRQSGESMMRLYSVLTSMVAGNPAFGEGLMSFYRELVPSGKSYGTLPQRRTRGIAKKARPDSYKSFPAKNEETEDEDDMDEEDITDDESIVGNKVDFVEEEIEGSYPDFALDPAPRGRPQGPKVPPTTAAPPSQPGPPKAPGAAPPPPPASKKVKVTCHFNAQVDAQVKLRKIFPVELTVSREQIEKAVDKINAESKAKVSPEKPLTIRLRPVVNIRVKGERAATIDVPAPGEPARVSFKIQPTHLGECLFCIDIWQEQVPVTTLQLAPTCVGEPSAAPKLKASVTAGTATPFIRHVNQLRIYERQEGKSCYYEYELEAREIGILDTYTSPRITGDRAKYVARLYEEIENLWETSGEDPKQMNDELRSFGASLFTKLFPEPLQRILCDNVKKFTSIQILSTEPFIPWELILIREPGKAIKRTDKFLGELGLIRWLHGWIDTEKLKIAAGRANYVVPRYTEDDDQLPAGEEEVGYLKEKFNATEIAPDPTKVLDLLKKPGSFDLLHFCCHGGADTVDIDNSRLMLMKKKTGNKPAYLTQTSVEACGMIGKDDSRPIIVLNACETGRLGGSLTGYGGFAKAFLKAGAGMFVGALWSVEDNAAVLFLKTLYDALLEGKTLSDATIEARRITAGQDSSTAIAYTVYGHPFATLDH